MNMCYNCERGVFSLLVNRAKAEEGMETRMVKEEKWADRKKPLSIINLLLSPHFPGAWLEPFLFLWPHVSASQNHCRIVENPSAEDGGIPYFNIFSQASAL